MGGQMQWRDRHGPGPRPMSSLPREMASPRGACPWAENPQDTAGGGCATWRLRRVGVPSTSRRAGFLGLAAAKPRGVCLWGNKANRQPVVQTKPIGIGRAGKTIPKALGLEAATRHWGQVRQTKPIGWQRDLACRTNKANGREGNRRSRQTNPIEGSPLFKQSQLPPDGSSRSWLSWTPASAGVTIGAGTAGTNEAN